MKIKEGDIVRQRIWPDSDLYDYAKVIATYENGALDVIMSNGETYGWSERFVEKVEGFPA